MKIKNRFVGMLLIGMALFFAPNAFGKEIPPLLVLPLSADGVPEDVASSLTELLVLELEKTKLYEVISEKDIKALLSQAELKQLLGEENESQLAEAGKRLNAEFLLRGSVGKVGATYLLSLTLIDVTQAKAVRRVNQTLTGKPDDLIGSLRSAVVALALEEKGIAPDITSELVDGLNIAQKDKLLFFHLRTGYELPIGAVTDKDSLAYMLPEMLNVNLSAGWHVLPWLQLVAESGVAFSIAERYSMQNKLLYSRIYGVEHVATSEPVVSTSEFDFSSMRIPLHFMARIQPPVGRMLPFIQGGIGASWQNYSADDEDAQRLYADRNIRDTDNPCPAPYTKDANGYCSRDLTLSPESDKINYWNLDIPLGVGVDYLLTHNIGIGVSAQYLLSYSLTKNDEDLNVLFVSEEITYESNGETVRELVGDAVPIRRLNQSIAVFAGFFVYF